MGVVLMMTFGTFTMIAAKLMLDTETDGEDGENKKFSKAMYQSLLMFFAMSFCYPIHQIVDIVKLLIKRKGKNGGSDYERAEGNEEEEKAPLSVTLKVCLYIFIYIYIFSNKN